MQLSHEWQRATAVFDERNLVSAAGLVPVLALAEQAGLSELIAGKVRLGSVRVRSAGVNPAGKLTSVIAGMCAGADSIADLEVIRSGGMGSVFTGVYASATIGQLLREFTHGHGLQLASVARAHLVALVARTGCLPGIGEHSLQDSFIGDGLSHLLSLNSCQYCLASPISRVCVFFSPPQRRTTIAGPSWPK